MDVDAPVLRRAPELALIDELAHTNAPGARNQKRYSGHRRGPRCGHRRHLHRQRPASGEPERRHLRAHRAFACARRFPTRCSSEADEVVLVDLTPEALQERLRAGKVYSPERAEVALDNFFRVDNLVGAAGARAARGRRGRRERAGRPSCSIRSAAQAVAERVLALVDAASRGRSGSSAAPGARPQRLGARARRALGAAAAASELSARMSRCSSRRCAGWPSCSVRTSSRRRATASSTRFSGSWKSAARPTCFVGTPERDAAAARFCAARSSRRSSASSPASTSGSIANRARPRGATVIPAVDRRRRCGRCRSLAAALAFRARRPRAPLRGEAGAFWSRSPARLDADGAERGDPDRARPGVHARRGVPARRAASVLRRRRHGETRSPLRCRCSRPSSSPPFAPVCRSTPGSRKAAR